MGQHRATNYISKRSKKPQYDSRYASGTVLHESRNFDVPCTLSKVDHAFLIIKRTPQMEEAQNDDSAPSTYNAPNPAALPPTDSPSSISSGKKRRASTLTSRGVANLTPEQLAKKRANDREAQRAIRERTKNQLETLERRIEQLTAQQPYQDLQHVVRQKEVVEAENEEIKRRLSSVLAILQPILGGCALGGELSRRDPTVALSQLLLAADLV